MEQPNSSKESTNNPNLAIIIPQYNYDAQTSQLIQSSDSQAYDNIVNKVSFQNGVCQIADGNSEDLSNSNTSIQSSEIASDVHFLGNADDLAKLSTSLYTNDSISYMIHSEGNAIIVGKEMTEDILSTEQQQSILNSISNPTCCRLTDQGPLLLENSNNEDYYITKPSKKIKHAIYNLNLHLQSIHSTSPIIITEDGKEKKPEILALTNAPAEEMEIKHPSLMNHVVLWSTNNHYCIVETDQPVFKSSSIPTTSVHVHKVNESFSEKEVIEMYLNNQITSSQQVLIYNIDNHTPKYVTIVQTEDIPNLPTFSSKQPAKAIDIQIINHNIQVLMDFLAKNCLDEGTYWLYKKEGDSEMMLINLSDLLGIEKNENLHMTEEEKKEKEITWKSMTAQLCIHYATILTRDFEYNNGILHTQQYLLLHGISLYNDILSLSPDNSILQHHYNDLLLDLYEKLGDSHISYCYQSNQINSQQIFSNQIDSNSILSHCYSALDCYHTTSYIVTKEMDHITKTVKTQRTLISRLQRYNTILLSVAQKIRLYLHHLLLFSVQKKIFTNILRDINTYLHCYSYYNHIIQEDQESHLFLSNIVLAVYSHATSSQESTSIWTLQPEWTDLTSQFNDFITHKGKDLYFIQNDPCFSLLLLAISFLKPSSIHYASILNEIGRYTQSHYQHQASTSTILTDSLFQSGISCYKQALQLFEKVNDHINSSVILCNICQFIHIPLQKRDSTLTLQEYQWLYSLLHWINEQVDIILRSNCNETTQHSVIQEFAECQVLLIQCLFEMENSQPGFISKVVGSLEKIENILDYCKSVYEIVQDEKKIVSVKYLLIQYYILSQQVHRLPDLETVKQYAYEVFTFTQDKDYCEAVNIIIWMCQLLISYSNQEGLSFTQRMKTLEDVIPQMNYVAPLFVHTNHDNKLIIFNKLKKQYISIIMQVVKLVTNEPNLQVKDKVLKRCRRCIKIFNNDDFYYFFANMEEETQSLFQLLL